MDASPFRQRLARRLGCSRPARTACAPAPCRRARSGIGQVMPTTAARRMYSADRRAPDPDRARDHPNARPAGILQAQNFSYLPHRQSLRGHRSHPPSLEPQRDDLASLRYCRQPSPSHPIHRWPPSIGMGGRFPSDSVAAFRRNQWPLCVGFRILCHRLRPFLSLTHGPSPFSSTKITPARFHPWISQVPLLRRRI